MKVVDIKKAVTVNQLLFPPSRYINCCVCGSQDDANNYSRRSLASGIPPPTSQPRAAKMKEEYLEADLNNKSAIPEGDSLNLKAKGDSFINSTVGKSKASAIQIPSDATSDSEKAFE